MHRLRVPWPEAAQLCESGPFKAFCASSLPTEDQRVVCRACSNPVDESGHRPVAQHRCRPPSALQRTLELHQEPEAAWQEEGRPSWTAPYVWETNYQ